MKFARIRRTVALTLVAAVFSVGLVRPRPARAVDTAVLVIGSIAAYVAVVVAGTMLMRHNSPSSWGLLPTDERLQRDPPQPGVHLAHRCKQSSGNLNLVCW